METTLFMTTMAFLMAFGFILIGVVIGELRERTSNRHSNNDSDPVDPDREHSSVERYTPSPEEIRSVLYLHRIDSRGFERDVFDYLIEREEKTNET